MTLPFYQDSAAAAKASMASLPKSVHTGLWFTRFYDGFTADWSVDKDAKRNWIDSMTSNTSGDPEQVTDLNARQRALCLALGGIEAELETDGPFVSGMGLSHPVENGFAFHPTLGTPYLPASGVKGLLRAWVEVWMSAPDEGNTRLAGRWFGAAKGNAQNLPECAGNLIFFDALPMAPVHLGCDIMTPHMGKWYESGADISPQTYATTAPADWHSPIPVPFLVVKKNTHFRFLIAPRLSGDEATDTQTRSDLIEAMQELKNAMEWLGAGAKTATGYGRMIDRLAEQAEERASGLRAAGIRNDEEQWLGAKLSWNKGKASLTVTHDGKSAWQSGAQGKATLQGLSEDARKRLDKGKDVLANATVQYNGNMITLISVV